MSILQGYTNSILILLAIRQEPFAKFKHFETMEM